MSWLSRVGPITQAGECLSRTESKSSRSVLEAGDTLGMAGHEGEQMCVKHSESQNCFQRAGMSLTV